MKRMKVIRIVMVLIVGITLATENIFAQESQENIELLMKKLKNVKTCGEAIVRLKKIKNPKVIDLLINASNIPSPIDAYDNESRYIVSSRSIKGNHWSDIRS